MKIKSTTDARLKHCIVLRVFLPGSCHPLYPQLLRCDGAEQWLVWQAQAHWHLLSKRGVAPSSSLAVV